MASCANTYHVYISSPNLSLNSRLIANYPSCVCLCICTFTYLKVNSRSFLQVHFSWSLLIPPGAGSILDSSLSLSSISNPSRNHGIWTSHHLTVTMLDWSTHIPWMGDCICLLTSLQVSTHLSQFSIQWLVGCLIHQSDHVLLFSKPSVTPYFLQSNSQSPSQGLSALCLPFLLPITLSLLLLFLIHCSLVAWLILKHSRYVSILVLLHLVFNLLEIFFSRCVCLTPSFQVLFLMSSAFQWP